MFSALGSSHYCHYHWCPCITKTGSLRGGTKAADTATAQSPCCFHHLLPNGPWKKVGVTVYALLIVRAPGEMTGQRPNSTSASLSACSWLGGKNTGWRRAGLSWACIPLLHLLSCEMLTSLSFRVHVHKAEANTGPTSQRCCETRREVTRVEPPASPSVACGPASPASPGSLFEKQPQTPPTEWNPLLTTHPGHQEARSIGDRSCAHRAALRCGEWAPPTALGRTLDELLARSAA